ncbi:MAG: sigma-54 dependent transcriptional regulator [Pedobacter sp.]|jgi:two-component system response regulator HydG
MAKILIVEDDLTFCTILEGFLGKKGHEISIQHTTSKGIAALVHNTYDLLLLDYRLPDGNGLDVLSSMFENGLQIPAIIMTSFNDVRTAVRAIRSGAFDYITKPVNPDELLMVITDALGRYTKSTKKTHTLTGFISGNSLGSQKLNEHIELVSPTDMSVILQGESGTGKEYASRAIHMKSKRANKPFIAVDCGALSKDLAASELFGHVKGAFTGALSDKKGQFEAADGGTLFLDEIGNLSYEVQVKLLRALQERSIQPVGSTRQVPVDVRIITATNDDLLSSINNGNFREDLYHRLNEFKIQLPALRDRGKDLAMFIEHFITLSNAELGRNVKTLSPEVLAIFERYDWPGNLRELKNVIKRMVLLSKTEIADTDCLSEEMTLALNDFRWSSDLDLKALNESNERALIEKTLITVKYNKSMAARLLNIDRKTLYSKIEKYKIE